jgi:hypothetical protein
MFFWESSSAYVEKKKEESGLKDKGRQKKPGC